MAVQQESAQAAEDLHPDQVAALQIHNSGKLPKMAATIYAH